MCVLQGGQSQQSVVCYDLYAPAMWGVENVRKLLTWNKRSREKVFTPCFGCVAQDRDLPKGSWVVAVPYFCRLIGAPCYG